MIKGLMATLGLAAALFSAPVAGSTNQFAPLEQALFGKSGDDFDVAVERAGKSVFRRSGYIVVCERRRSCPAYPSMQWRWASITKQVVAVLVLQEVSKGKIDLDAPLTRYLPKFQSANAPSITVRQLLRHQTGLPNPDDTAAGAGGFASYYLPKFSGNRDPLQGYCAGPVKGPAGAGWAYNNCDYIVAGNLLKAVTGKPWERLVKERIAKPLGLRSLKVLRNKDHPEGSHFKLAGEYEPELAFSAFGAAGSLAGSIDDLLAFDRALMNGKLLPPAQMAELWDGQAELGYIALGQWVFTVPLKGCAAPVKIVERRGAIGAVQVRNFILPDQKVVAAVFVGNPDFDFGEIWQGSGFSHDLLALAACGTGAS